MQKLNIKSRILFLLAVAFVACWCMFAIESCRNPMIDNVNLLRPSDSLNLQKDSVAITVITQVQAPQVSSGITQGVLGSMFDRNFGTMYCGFYGQLPLTTAGTVIPAGAILDSAVLSLAYNGQLGLCNKPINLAVYELTDSISSYLNYYTNTTFHVKTPAIGTLNNFIPNEGDSIYIAATATYVSPSLSIDLSKSFGESIISDSAGLQNDSLFLAHFKGIYVTATSAATGDGIMYINLNSPQSAVTFYYHYLLGGVVYSQNLSLTFSGINVNHYDCINNNTATAAAIKAGPTAQKVYLEAGSGAGGLITFSLDTFTKHGPVGINKAEIVFSQSPPDTAFPAPEVLNLLRIDDAGVGQTLDDAAYPTFGGILTDETVTPTLNIYRYRFNISRYFQKLVQGIYNNNGLFVQIQNGNQVGDRVVLTNTSNNKNYKISLSVTYTKL